jgi:4-diphosphocytidyl-2-C-methyl-D-erythritol kinase
MSVMQSISLADQLTLESIVPGESDGGEDEIVCSGVPGDPRENLAARALRAYREATGWDTGPLRLSILKRIPVAAGLGGGSADAAATLRLARHVSGIDARGSAPEIDGLLLGIARELGADVPAQIEPVRWPATGAGERLRPLPAPSEEELGVLVLPVPAELSTAAVYARAEKLGIRRTFEDLQELAREVDRALAGEAELSAVARGLLHNDLQTPAMSLCPLIAPALKLAQETGPDAAFVSGSGPTVVALFGRSGPGDKHAGPERARRAAERLAGRTPSPICAVLVNARFARAVDVPVRHNHDR